MLSDELERKNSELFEELVPSQGSADTKAGELLRAVNTIGHRWWNDGDQIGIGYGNETCNAAARYILEQYDNTEMMNTVVSIWGMYSEKLYEAGVELLVEQTIKYIEDHPELKTEENLYDMSDFYEPSDREWEEEEEDDEYGVDLRKMDLREYLPLDWRR